MDAKEERLGVFLNPRVSVDIESLKPLGPFYLPLASAFSDRCVKWWGSCWGRIRADDKKYIE